MRVNTFSSRAGAIALALALVACGTGQNADEASDAELIGEADDSDPALTAALEDEIMVDRDLETQSNENMALPGRTVSGAPVPDTLHTAADAQRAISAGRLLDAPEATRGDEECPQCGARSAARGETTLGALADEQASTPDFEPCPEPVEYGMGWAARLPRAFDVYPNAELLEAAGKDTEQCHLRVVSFRTTASMDRLIDWYYTRAIRTGYSAEHQLRHGDHVLGGYRARDEGAYYIIFAPRSDGGTDVDIIANGER